MSGKSNPPATRWLRELRDRLWTSEDTGYQVLDVVIHHALMDGADSEQREAALARAMELVKTVWDRSVSGTTAIGDYVESHGGDANHWSGVERWVHSVETKDESEKAMNDEMIERVARWAQDETHRRSLRTWEQLSPQARNEWLFQARAAIEGEK